MRRTILVLALAFAWITTFGVLDAVYPQLSFYGTLSLAAVGASLFASWRLATLIWAYGFTWSLFLGADGEYWSRFHFLRIFLSMFIGGSAIFIAFIRERREHSFEVVSGVAMAAQKALLREVPARIGGARVAARWRSAAEDSLVGGDFFEAVVTRYGLRLIVGDVAGRGLDAVGLAGLVLGGFREAALSADDLAELARRLDETVEAYTDRDEYATAVLVELNGREMSAVSCGHPFPFLLDGERHPPVPIELPTNLPLGYGSDPLPSSRTLRQGERLLLYTDGLSESRDADGRFFDVATDGAEALRIEDPAAALDALISTVERYSEAPSKDDIALLIVEPSIG